VRNYESDSKESGAIDDRISASGLHGTKAIVVGLFRVILDRPQMDIEDNLFELGIASQQVIELVSRISLTFDRHVSIATVYEHPTASAMAAWLQSSAGGPIEN
jgi:mycobactin peptide synthetase MbtE